MIRRRLAVVVLVAACLAGCTSGWNPIPADEVAFLDRSESVESRNIRVTASVPDARETRTIFGVNLYGRGVQPVWLEIENLGTEPFSFLPFGLDADYLSPLETATLFPNKKYEGEMRRYFFQNGLSPSVNPGEKREGFVFTHLDEGTKAFNVDVAGDDWTWHHTFFIPVPGLKVDHYNVDFKSIYPAEDVAELTESELVEALAALPCCASDKKGEGSADPLNLVVVGDPADVYYAFIRAGWDETEIVQLSSGIKTAFSFMTGGEYRYSPVSSLYVFDRPQDVAFQKARDNIHERNHLRLWMTPYRLDGKSVWIGQISRDIGVRFTTKTITTHKIDPDVDETREFLVENLAYSQALAGLGYAEGAIAAPIDQPRHNLTGDPYVTDGLRAVLWISSDPVGFDEIKLVEWATVEN